MKKSVIFFFLNSAEHRQLPDVTELCCSTLGGDRGTRSKGVAEIPFLCSHLSQV